MMVKTWDQVCEERKTAGWVDGLDIEAIFEAIGSLPLSRKKSKRNHCLKRGVVTEYLESHKDIVDCEICGSTEKLNVDHNNKTNKIRGKLCSRCNTGIGCFQDNPSLLRIAIKYLEDREAVP